MSRFVITVVFVSSIFATAQNKNATEQQGEIKLTLKVEPENSAFTSSEPISSNEVRVLTSLIGTRIRELKTKHVLVPESDLHSHLFLSVVASKLTLRDGRPVFVVSSEISVGTLEQHLDTVNHNVLVQPNLTVLADGIVHQFEIIEIQGRLGILK